MRPLDPASPPTECPFGASLQKYWDRLSSLERQMHLDEEALYSLIIQEAALAVARQTPGSHVIDAFAGAGGSAIGFARSGKRVTAIELDPTRLEMARYNARLFGVADSIEFIHGDALEILPTSPGDTVFPSPPWGGPEYTRRDLFTLSCFSPPGDRILEAVLQTKKNIVMQLPKNFDFNELRCFPGAWAVTPDIISGKLLSYTLVVLAA